MNTEYLSMWEASKLCSYSQEYLSLLSRRGLLKAVKKSNKWFTTIPWLSEYIADKKPDEVALLRKKTSPWKVTGMWSATNKLWYMTIAVLAFFILSGVALFHMSNKISDLERKNIAIDKVTADIRAGFDASVLEVETGADSGILSP